MLMAKNEIDVFFVCEITFHLMTFGVYFEQLETNFLFKGFA